MIGLFKYTFSGSGGSQDLQSVCDIGNNTVTGIILNGNGLTVINPVTGGNSQNISFQQNQFNEPGTGFNMIISYPSLTANRVIDYQDGDGTLAFLSDVTTGDLQAVTTVGNITTNDIYCNDIYIADIANGGYLGIHCGDGTLEISDPGSDNRSWLFDYSLLTPSVRRAYILQDRDGTLAMLDDIPSGMTQHRNYTHAVTVGATSITVSTTRKPTYVGGITPKNLETAANFYNTLGFSIAYGAGNFTVTFYLASGVIGTTWNFDYLIAFT